MLDTIADVGHDVQAWLTSSASIQAIQSSGSHQYAGSLLMFLQKLEWLFLLREQRKFEEDMHFAFTNRRLHYEHLISSILPNLLLVSDYFMLHPPTA